jgi:hypothetical protein
MCFHCRVKTRQYERAKRGWNPRWLKKDGNEEDEEEINMNQVCCETYGMARYRLFLLDIDHYFTWCVQLPCSRTTLILSTHIDGRRKCTIRSCTKIIPAMEAYRWKMCETCRERTRRQAQERKYGADTSSAQEEQEEQEDEDVPLAKRLQVKREIQNLKSLKLTFKGRTIASVDTRAPEPIISPTPSQLSSRSSVLPRSMVSSSVYPQ